VLLDQVVDQVAAVAAALVVPEVPQTQLAPAAMVD
jgi:hypothetical protein